VWRDAGGLDAVVDRHDAAGRHASGDHLRADGVTINDDGVREPERNALRSTLPRCAASTRLAFRRDPNRRASERSREHAKDVWIEAVRVHDLNTMPTNESGASRKLPHHLQVVQRLERILRKLSELQLCHERSQRAVCVQCRDVDAKASVLHELSCQVHGLALGSSFVKTIHQKQNAHWDIYFFGRAEAIRCNLLCIRASDVYL
jgi:hypothetical protein